MRDFLKPLCVEIATINHPTVDLLSSSSWVKLDLLQVYIVGGLSYTPSVTYPVS